MASQKVDDVTVTMKHRARRPRSEVHAKTTASSSIRMLASSSPARSVTTTTTSRRSLSIGRSKSKVQRPSQQPPVPKLRDRPTTGMSTMKRPSEMEERRRSKRHQILGDEPSPSPAIAAPPDAAADKRDKKSKDILSIVPSIGLSSCFPQNMQRDRGHR